MSRVLPLICIVLICIVLICESFCVAQDTHSNESNEDDVIANAINLRLQTMQLALNESSDPDSDLEIVGKQRDALETLAVDYKQMVQELSELEKTEGGMKAGLALCMHKLDAFEQRLSSEILLPHQSAALRSMVFAELVKQQGGDLVSALARYYPRQFKLEGSQKKRFKEISNATTDKIEKAKQEFQEKLRQIASATETDVRSVLTPEQLELLNGLQGPDS